MPVNKVYNVDGVVEQLKDAGITKTSIYRAIALGKLRAIKVGRRFLISEKSLNEFLEGSSQTVSS